MQLTRTLKGDYMAETTLYFYNTDFKLEEHCIYDSLETYLSSLNAFEISNYQYLKPVDNFDRMIKINANQASISPGMIFGYNYLKAVDTQTGRVDYYYVLSNEWVSENCISVRLRFDVLNSLRNFISFDDSTHITRRFKDRWQKYNQSSGASYVRPLVDKMAESISAVPQVRKSKSTFTTDKWHLVYLTDSESTSELEASPVSCYAIPDKATAVKVVSGNFDVDYLKGVLSANNYYYFTPGISGELTIHVSYKETSTGTTINTKTAVIGDSVSWLVLYLSSSGELLFTDNTLSAAHEVTEISIEASKATVAYVPFTTYLDQPPSERLIYIDPNHLLNLAVSETVQTIIPAFSEWYADHKTDAKLIKILALPFPPFQPTWVKMSGVQTLLTPTGWFAMANDFGLKLIDPNIKLGINLQTTYAYPIYPLSEFIKADRSDAYETKLLNSQYSTKKWVYDSNSWQFKPEYGKYDSLTANFSTINMKCCIASEMSSNIAINFDAKGMMYEDDYGEWLSSTRSLEVPYYTNQYLNYVRYGESYDWRNLGYSLAQKAVTGTGSTITSAVSMSALAAKVGATSAAGPIGAVVGATVTAAGLMITAAQQQLAIEAKISKYQSQASEASTNNDLSLFEQMTGNQILEIDYEPIEELKSMLARYFDYFGYATDEYGQMVDSRYWNDYYQAEVVFSKGCLINDTAKSTIRNAYQEGVRIYHYHGGYDINKEKNNYEVALVNG